MNNTGKKTKGKKSNNMLKNKTKKGGINGKIKTKKLQSINDAYYNGLIEQCIINGIAVTCIERIEKTNK